MAAFSVAALILAACGHPPPPPPPQPPPAPMPPPVIGPQTMSERSLMTMAADLAFARQLHPDPRRQGGLNRSSRHCRASRARSSSTATPTTHPVGKALKKRGIADNLDLSSKRANEVVRYLRSKGVNPNIMSAKGRGDTHPVAPNDTPAGRAQNRRIEVVVEQPS